MLRLLEQVYSLYRTILLIELAIVTVITITLFVSLVVGIRKLEKTTRKNLEV